MKNKIVITGGLGFIASHFIRKILKNKSYKVLNIDKISDVSISKKKLNFEHFNNYYFEKCDLKNFNKLKKIIHHFKPNIVINFAAESHVDNSIVHPKAFIDSNIIGTFNLINILNNLWKQNKPDYKFIHISTDEVYGSLNFKEKAFTEDNTYKPNSPYSASKASSDLLVRSWFKTYNFNGVITNCSNNYGPWQNKEKLIPKTIINAINKKPIPLYGDGKNIRDWIHVDDHVNAILKVMKFGKVGERYNIGGNCEKSNIEIINTICDILQKKLNNNYNYRKLIRFVKDRPGHDLRYSINDRKIRKKLNFKNKINFYEGINSTIDWYIKNN